MEHQYPSRLLEKAVGEFAKLPGIGRKDCFALSVEYPSPKRG